MPISGSKISLLQLNMLEITSESNSSVSSVKLIQRVGRVDRIGTEHQTIDIINFLPTTKIEQSLSLQEKVRSKITTIKRVLGDDQQILEETEEFDSDVISNIFNCNNDILEPDIGILNIGESKSELDADRIKNDNTKLQHIKKLQFGIRSVAGSGKLLIACEAQELLINENGSNLSEHIFRKHYEITSNGVKPIWTTKFLKLLGENNVKIIGTTNSHYDAFVKEAWLVFDRDMKNTMAKKSLLTHQAYFDKKLRQLSENPDMTRRVMSLLPFINQRMPANHQPYKKLGEIRKKIDKDIHADENMLLTELESIHEQYRHIKYIKKIHKPKILYSMMVNQ